MSTRPVTILVAALGGEGGGVLADWLVEAAMSAGFPVQSTSIPGVAQRTGATTYYVEIYPETHAALGGRRPVLALYPSPAEVDVMVASELIEAARAVENGYVTPDRTTLVAATHRVYATIEKMQMGDGRFDAERALRACREMAARSILFDLTRSPRTRALALNAVLLGAVAGAGVLPLARSDFEAAIRARGVAVEANLAAFAAGWEIGQNGPAPDIAPESGHALPRALAVDVDAMLAETAQRFPAAAIKIVEEGVKRLVDYQDEAYARLYLDRLDALRDLPEKVLAEAARHLALWMAYEDVIRVAQLKSRPERLARIRAEVRAKPEEPVHVTEFFKPGIDEIAAVLPAGVGRVLRDWARSNGLLDRFHLRMRLRSTRISGYLRLLLLAKMKRWRRRSLRFAEEQALIEKWLDAVARAAAIAPEFGLEAAVAAKVLKGYGDTHRRGRANFEMLMTRIIEPAIAEQRNAAPLLRAARQAALADEEGKALAKVLPPAAPMKLAAE
ncbi:MAG: indolepyruvate oxidoreductase subunit beta family protein [Rhodospirillales bacterium]|nr:indolepyruvate oxidoreductase subunit beta family protein [Rhodospirillales bacterium]